MNTLNPFHQTVWRKPAVFNFLLGGTGCGLYLICTLISIVDNTVNSPAQIQFYKLYAPILVSIGLVVVSFEAGKTFRAIYLLKNLRKSWMSREVLAAYIFIGASLVDFLMQFHIASVIAASAAAGVLVTHGYIIYTSKGLPAWNNRLTIPLFIISGLTSGSAVSLIIADASMPIVNIRPIVAFLLILTTMILWFLYLYQTNDSEFYFATRALRRVSSILFIAGIGHIIPAVLLGSNVGLVVFGYENLFAGKFITAAGVLAVLGAYGIRQGIILQSGFFRRITLHDKVGYSPIPGHSQKDMMECNIT